MDYARIGNGIAIGIPQFQSAEGCDVANLEILRTLHQAVIVDDNVAQFKQVKKGRSITVVVCRQNDCQIYRRGISAGRSNIRAST